MSDRLLVGTRKGLFVYDRNGGWSITGRHFVGDPCNLVLHDPRDGAIYAVLTLGHFGVHIHRSDDGGLTWTEVGAPTYPEGGEESLKDIWALEAGGDDQPGRLWAGTLPGGLFLSDDRGETWRLVESLWNEPERQRWFGGGADVPGIHSVVVDPRDSKKVGVAVSCGGYWRSEDDGATWTVSSEGMYAEFMPPEGRNDPAIQDPHHVEACATHPDVLWCQHHNGAFRSVDGGLTWAEIHPQPSKFGFPVAAHPTDPDTAWFVPAVKDECRVPVDGKVVVARTRDGGATFDVLRNGLPQQDAYDLVFRHALHVDETGDRLAFGSTTGSLWLSEDGGDGWKTLSKHLPPVYAVRFVR